MPRCREQMLQRSPSARGLSAIHGASPTSRAVAVASAHWLRMLESARSAEASGKELVLKNASGVVIATLKRRDLD